MRRKWQTSLETSRDISVISRGMRPKQQTTKCLSTMCRSTHNHLTVLCKRMLGHRIRQRIWSYQNLDWQLFDFLICIDKNTQVFYFTNGHFWPMLNHFHPMLILSLSLLIHCSVSLYPSFLLSSPFHFTCWDFTQTLHWFDERLSLQ